VKITVCELGNRPDVLARDWRDLVRPVEETGSRLVLLAERTFNPWFCWKKGYDAAVWAEAEEAPILTLDIDPASVESAKRTYPRYIRE
jgi:hypothetical protein